MSDFNRRELMVVVVAVTMAIILGIWAAFGIAGYLAAANPNDPLAKAGGLSAAQQRAVEHR